MFQKNISSILKKGGIGVFPTDTLYGIVGTAFSPDTVERIYALKSRKLHKPFIVLISSVSDLQKFGVKLKPGQTDFAKSVWPGPVSLIFQCKLKKFEYLHRGTKSLAFRLPDDAKLLELLKKTGPLVAPSANPEGMIPALTIADAKNYFDKKVDFYVSGGRKDGSPSHIVSFLTNEPKILR